MGYTKMIRVEKTIEFAQWLDGLGDVAGRARILVRVERLIAGNPGQHRNLAGGVSELEIDFGPGYRVYDSQRGSVLLLLLIGGDKSSQSRDVERAIDLATNYKE